MLGNGTCPPLVPHYNSTQLVHRAVTAHPITGKPQVSSTKFVEDRKAYEWEQQSNAEALKYTASFPTDTIDFVGYLLTKIDPAYITDPHALLVPALENNHTTLFNFIEKNFGITCTEKAMSDAIKEGRLAHVEKLFNASVTIKRARPLLILTAITAFSDTDTAATTAQRFAILKTVLNQAEVKDVPTILDFDMPPASQNVLDGIKELLSERLYPPRLCMTETAGETPLHRAAAAGDYATCKNYLSKMQGPLTKDEKELSKNLETSLQFDPDKPFADQPDILRAFERFLVNQDLLLERMQQMKALAKKQLVTQNCRGLTAYDVAVKAFGEPNSERLKSHPDYSNLIKLLALLKPDDIR